MVKSPASYKAALHEAREELLTLAQKKSEIEQRMQALVKTIEGLEFLACEREFVITPEIVEDRGLTQTIRDILRASKVALQPTQIRDMIVKATDNNDKNLLVNIHTSLRRMKKLGETLDDEAGGFRWVSPVQRAVWESAMEGLSGETPKPKIMISLPGLLSKQIEYERSKKK